MSLSLSAYGSEVFYSQLDSPEELRRLFNFVKDPRETILYRQVFTLKNLFLLDGRLRQPLLNGLEFNSFRDYSLGWLITKASSKKQENSKLDFDLNNFYRFVFAFSFFYFSQLMLNTFLLLFSCFSVSGSNDKRYEIRLNNDNKAAIKKKIFLNTRLRMDIDGTKNKGSAASYNWNLSPGAELQLFKIE